MIEQGIIHEMGACELLEQIPGSGVHLVLTDPPYGVDFQSRMPVDGALKPKIAADKPREAIRLMRFCMDEFARILVEGGVCMMFAQGGGPNSLLDMVLEPFKAKFTLETILVWDRMVPGLGWVYRPQWDAVLVGYKGEKRKTWNGPANACNVLREMREIPAKGEHPTPKPLKLIHRLILDNSNKGDLVIDPFCGGGTVPLSCELLGRRWIACDLEPQWVALARGKLEAERAQIKMHEADGSLAALPFEDDSIQARAEQEADKQLDLL